MCNNKLGKGDVNMRRMLYLGVMCAILLTGCGNKELDKSKDDAVSTQTEAVTSQTDDGVFDINADIDKDEGEYNASVEYIKTSICELGYVDKVEVSPENYTEYSKSEGVTITVTLDDTKDIPEDYKESIDNFVDSTNYYDKYELKYE